MPLIIFYVQCIRFYLFGSYDYENNNIKIPNTPQHNVLMNISLLLLLLPYFYPARCV